jgi:hypothetical protein
VPNAQQDADRIFHAGIRMLLQRYPNEFVRFRVKGVQKMSLSIVFICLALVVGIYFYNNPLRHGPWFLSRRMENGQ